MICPACNEYIEPPEPDPETNPNPMCWACKARPCEGWSAFCHDCGVHRNLFGPTLRKPHAAHSR